MKSRLVRHVLVALGLSVSCAPRSAESRACCLFGRSNTTYYAPAARHAGCPCNTCNYATAGGLPQRVHQRAGDHLPPDHDDQSLHGLPDHGRAAGDDLSHAAVAGAGDHVPAGGQLLLCPGLPDGSLRNPRLRDRRLRCRGPDRLELLCSELSGGAGRPGCSTCNGGSSYAPAAGQAIALPAPWCRACRRVLRCRCPTRRVRSALRRRFAPARSKRSRLLRAIPGQRGCRPALATRTRSCRRRTTRWTAKRPVRVRIG